MNKHSDYDMLYQLVILIYVAISPPSCLFYLDCRLVPKLNHISPMIDDIKVHKHTLTMHIFTLYSTIYSMHIKLYFSFIYYLQIFKYSFVFADSVSAVALSSLFISYIDTYTTSNRKNDLKFRFNSQISLYKFKI